MIYLSRRNFLKGIAAGAGLALASGIPGILPVEQAIAEEVEARGLYGTFADFLIKQDGGWQLVGQALRVDIHREIEEISFGELGDEYRRFLPRYVAPGRLDLDLIIDEPGLRLMEHVLVDGRNVETEVNMIDTNGRRSQFQMNALLMGTTIAVDRNYKPGFRMEADLRLTGPLMITDVSDA